MKTPPHHTAVVSVIILLALSPGIAIGQGPPTKEAAPASAQTGPSVSELALEEGTTTDMVFGPDGMLYIISRAGGRYRKGTISKLNPDAFSRLQPGADKRNHASPEDFLEVYAIGQPGEMKSGISAGDPTRIIAGADGKLYLSVNGSYCGQFDPVSGTFKWVKFGPPIDVHLPSGDPNETLADVTANCFAVTADGMLWCKAQHWGYKGKVFHTRGEGKDLGALPGTDDWNFAALGSDGYVYGATDDYLARIKIGEPDTKVQVLHVFTAKDDHPFEAPTLLGDKLFGYCRIGGDERTWNGGYIYSLSSDGQKKDYANIGEQDSGPSESPVTDGKFLYGMRSQGLFKVWPDLGQWAVVLPTKEEKHVDALCIHDGVAYVLNHRYQAVDSIFRIPLSNVMATPIPRNAAQLLVGSWRGSNNPPTENTFKSDGTGIQKQKDQKQKDQIFKLRWTLDGNILAYSDIQKLNGERIDQKYFFALTNVTDTQFIGMQPGAGVFKFDRVGPPPSVTADTSGPASPAGASAGAKSAGDAGSNESGPAADGTSVFHKRQGASSGGTTTSTGSTGTAASGKGASFKSAPGNQVPQAPPASSYNPRPSFGGASSGTGGTKTRSVVSGQANDSGPLSSDSGADATQPDGGAYEPAPGGNLRSGGANSSGTPDYSASSATDTSDVSAIAGMVVQAYSNGDLAAFSSMYANTVDYMGNGRKTNAQVQRELSQYFTKWPVRQWSLVGPVRVDPVGTSAQRIVFSAQYDVSNPDTNRHTAGIATETLIVKDDGSGVMKITSHHEKTTGSSDSDTESNKKSKRRGQRERVYDGRPIIPLPPNIPWPPGLPRP